MSSLLKRKFKKVRDSLVDRLVRFHPYTGEIAIAGTPLRFFYANPQSSDWYDPVEAHTAVELEWLANHLRGKNERVVDAGAYHGLYTLVAAKALGEGGSVVTIDPSKSNCDVIEVNLLLNGLTAQVECCAVAAEEGTIRMSDQSCGHIVASGGVERAARRLETLVPDATVVKLDIEGEEFNVLPRLIDAMPNVHTWNVEIHPGPGREPRQLLDAFVSRGFELQWLNRPSATVEPCDIDRPWLDRTSVIATRSV